MKTTTPPTDQLMKSPEAVQSSQPAAAPAAPVPGGISPERADEDRRSVAASPGVQTLRDEKQDRSTFAALSKRLEHYASETTGDAARYAQLLAAIFACHAEEDRTWSRDVKVRELEKLPQKWNEQLGWKLAAGAPCAIERAGMFGAMAPALYKEIEDLADQALTRPEQMRLSELIIKLEHSGRRLVKNFYKTQARGFRKKRKKK